MRTLGTVKIARRYATALFRTADRFGRVENVRTDLEALVEARRQSPAFHRVMDSPLVTRPDKRRIVEHALSSADEITRRFVVLLVDKDRVEVLPAIYEEFTRCADEAAGIARAYATSAAPLTEEQTARLAEAISKLLNRPVYLQVRVEPDMLGGVSVRVGDTVWDGSIRGALEAMRERMLMESAMAARISSGQ